jgi:hypothetical protein
MNLLVPNSGRSIGGPYNHETLWEMEVKCRGKYRRREKREKQVSISSQLPISIKLHWRKRWILEENGEKRSFVVSATRHWEVSPLTHF